MLMQSILKRSPLSLSLGYIVSLCKSHLFVPGHSCPLRASQSKEQQASICIEHPTTSQQKPKSIIKNIKKN